MNSGYNPLCLDPDLSEFSLGSGVTDNPSTRSHTYRVPDKVSHTDTDSGIKISIWFQDPDFSTIVSSRFSLILSDTTGC